MDGPDYILDIDSLRRSEDAPSSGRPPRRERRAWIAIRWRCCGAYSRIYRNRRGNAYEGHCPSCARHVRVGIDPTKGVDCRFFEAG